MSFSLFDRVKQGEVLTPLNQASVLCLMHQGFDDLFLLEEQSDLPPCPHLIGEADAVASEPTHAPSVEPIVADQQPQASMPPGQPFNPGQLIQNLLSATAVASSEQSPPGDSPVDLPGDITPGCNTDFSVTPSDEG